MNIQNWAEECSKNLELKGKLNNFNNYRIFENFLDKIFLKIISKNSIYTPHIFYHFSKNIVSETFIRFMIGTSSLLDIIKVIYAMPKKFFIKCLIKN